MKTNFGVEGAKRSTKMGTTNFYKSFSKNILLCMSSRLSKMRSVHTYVMPWTFYFGLICIHYSIVEDERDSSCVTGVLQTELMS